MLSPRTIKLELIVKFPFSVILPFSFKANLSISIPDNDDIILKSPP